jgi:hypothetical protein
VLSIQSHTVSGYVGNRCSVFTLQVPRIWPPFLRLCKDVISKLEF